GHILLVQLYKYVQGIDLIDEVAFVQFLVQDGFIEVLKLSHGELFGEEFKTYGHGHGPALQSRNSLLDHFSMVKYQAWGFPKIKPSGRIDLDSVELVGFHVDQCKIGHRNGTLAGIPVHLAIGVELFHVDIAEAREGTQDPNRGLVQVFVLFQKSPDKGPLSLFGFEVSFDQQDFQVGFVKAENYTVHGQEHLVFLLIKI